MEHAARFRHVPLCPISYLSLPHLLGTRPNPKVLTVSPLHTPVSRESAPLPTPFRPPAPTPISVHVYEIVAARAVSLIPAREGTHAAAPLLK